MAFRLPIPLVALLLVSPSVHAEDVPEPEAVAVADDTFACTTIEQTEEVAELTARITNEVVGKRLMQPYIDSCWVVQKGRIGRISGLTIRGHACVALFQKPDGTPDCVWIAEAHMLHLRPKP